MLSTPTKPTVKTTTTPLPLLQERDYQVTIRATTKRELTQPGVNSVLIVSPTGSGKSVLGLMAAMDLYYKALDEGFAPDKVCVAWVAHRRNLLRAVQRENLMIGCPNLHPVSMFDRHVGEWIGKYDRVIAVYDEAHHFAAETCLTLHDTLNPHQYIGLSATPLRTDKVSLCFNRTVSEAGYQRLMDRGWLSKYDMYTIPEWTPETVAVAWKARDGVKGWGKSVMFFHTLVECERAAGLIRSQGARVEVVTGSSNSDKQLSDFEQDRVDVLISMAVLTEGFDAPSLQTVFVRRSDSRLVITQMSGRVLRLWKGMRKQIVQCLEGFSFVKVAEPVEKFVLRMENLEFEKLGTSDEYNLKVVENKIKLGDAARRNLTKKPKTAFMAKKLRRGNWA